ncbi:MAG: cytochrome c3 family protein [Alphaproteobacteria bacterium]
MPAVDDSFGPHNLNLRYGTDSAMCSFCHTPQGQQNGEPGWALRQEEPEYQSFDSRRADGGIEIVGSASVACLSCHDGSQARDSVANLPFMSDAGDALTTSWPTARDHPVGIAYSGYRPQSKPDPIRDNRLRREVIGGRVQWWVDLEAAPNGVRDKTDVILYTRGKGPGAQPYIECASCHDPHMNPGEKFLRAPNANSNLCQACHNY